jgi:hypothetical protein
MALRNLGQEALSSENVQLIDNADDSLPSVYHYCHMLSFFAVASCTKF